MSTKKVVIGLAIGVWVAAYAWIQSQITASLGIEAELWPVLMAPGIVGLLGGGKSGQKKYYKMMLTGILAALAFVLAEHAFYPLIGDIGVLLPLALIVALIVMLGDILPEWFGGVSFIAFCASTILTHDILALTISRIAVLFVGATIFLFIEHLIIKLLTGQSADTTENTAS